MPMIDDCGKADRCRLLFLSYYFPPRPEVGGKRIDKMCAAALKSGWRPFVLTTRGNRSTDISLSQQTGDVYVKRIDRSAGRKSPATGSMSLNDKIVNVLKYCKGIIADIDVFYLGTVRLLAAYEIPVFLATFPPHRVLLAAYLAKLTVRRALWVADFRDPWICEAKNISFNIFPRISRYLLRAILKRADLVLAVSRSNLEKLAAVADFDISEKCLYMPNCVDLCLYEGIDEIRHAPADKIAMGHLGDLDYLHRDPRPFLAAFNLLRRETSPLFGELELHFWGESGRWGGDDLPGLIHNDELGGIVFYHGVVDHRSALGIVKGLDVLVLFAFNQPLQVPAKTYEYLLSGKPILALCEEQSETFAVLSRFEDVVIVTSADSQAIKAGLEKIIDAVKEGGRKCQQRDLSAFAYEEIFSPLYARLESMAREKGWLKIR